MALFSTKKKTDKTTTVAKDAKSSDARIDWVLRSPRITEKAAYSSDANVYTFNINPTATKEDVKRAVAKVYKVTPLRVRTVTIPTKTVRSRRGKPGQKGGGKKAYVYLKKGQTIELL